MTDSLASDLEISLESLARVPVLLVACDYDGTLAPIVNDPESAHPYREAIVALKQLAASSQTHVAVISGRALRDLARLTGLPSDIHMVGSHGSEFDLDFASRLPPKKLELRNRLVEKLGMMVEDADGFHCEVKPASIALHYRNASKDHADRIVEDIQRGPAAWEGVFTRHGKKVVELSVVETSKGEALELMRHRVGAGAVIFFGDDVTDEDAFRTLAGPDIGVKVGEGESQAKYRVAGPEEVARILARLSELRSAWLAGADAVPIEQHGYLSDQRTAALISPRGRIVWYCVPRIDGVAVFAELLGGPSAGYFDISPVNAAGPAKMTYVGSSLILQSKWPHVTVTDFLDCSRGQPRHRAGRSDLIRIVEGTGQVHIEFAPRLDFGRVATGLQVRPGGLQVEAMHDPLIVRSPGISWNIIEHGTSHTAVADVTLGQEPLILELCYGTGALRDSAPRALDRRKLTERYWTAWARTLKVPPVAPQAVRRSALTLRGLCYGPTGAILAASTTSLPEHLGGVRNWDYRFCWLRDAALSASALLRLGSQAEAMAFLDWILHVLENCESPDRLRPLYTVLGEQLGPEADIAELTGYHGSRPVRIGNSAGQQVQLDVFGPIVDLVAQLADHEAPLSSHHWRLVEAMVDAVQRRWHEPDHGIWEIRRPRRHHVYSKVMCWLTVDRAISVTRKLLDREHSDWSALRDRIADDIVRNGFKPEVQAFTAAYDDIDLDASALHVGLSGLLPADDPRYLATLDAVEKRLRHGPTVFRYRADDGLPGMEGGFHLCTSWLIQAYTLVGRWDDAAKLFEQLVKLAGTTGLLSEQYDPVRKIALGNYPQAYSHLAIIESAVCLASRSEAPLLVNRRRSPKASTPNG